MREIEIQNESKRIIKVHDVLSGENVKFVTNLSDTAKATEEFLKIPNGEGLVIFRARSDFPCNQNALIKNIVKENKYEGYFWNARKDIDASPPCIELIVVR